MRLYSAKETCEFKEPTNQKLQPAAPAPKELCLYTVLCSVLQRVAVCVWVGGWVWVYFEEAKLQKLQPAAPRWLGLVGSLKL